MVNRHRIPASRERVLSLLSKEQLVRISFELSDCAPRQSKSKILYYLNRAKDLTLAQQLSVLTVRDLRGICVQLDLPRLGKKKDLVAELSRCEGRSLKGRILKSLRGQGFSLSKGGIAKAVAGEKQTTRDLHQEAVNHKRALAKHSLGRLEPDLLKWIANGNEVDPQKIKPTVIEVERGSLYEKLFRYICLHWSIPISSGYGRRLRVLVMDENNGKVIGIIGLGDPVYALAARDKLIGWNNEQKKTRLRGLVDAFVIGAVPPYSRIIAGKLVAMIATTMEVVTLFNRKYSGQTSRIQQATAYSELALISTTSALGRSSIYNRLSLPDRKVFSPVGYTRGFGDFQFLNGLYEEMTAFARYRCDPTAKNEAWGTGFRNRREVVKKCLNSIGLSDDLLCHGIQREVFLAPLASNTYPFLRGEQPQLEYFDTSVDQVSDYCRQRWMLPRSQRDVSYLAFRREDYRLWKPSL